MHHRLLRIRGFLPYLSVVLINAIIDLGHKIVIQNTIFKCYSGATQIALTALVNACILLPFIMFFTPAGFLSDRFPKHGVMRWTAGFAIPLTALIYGSYLLGWFEAAFVLTLILAAQSAFYSPAKYGYIKEMAGKEHLGMANGVVQAVTIVAILLGGVLFSVVFEALIGEAQSREDILRAIAPCGILLMVGAVLQTLLALRIPPYHGGNPNLRLRPRSYLRGEYLQRNISKLHKTEIIWFSVLSLSMFWAVNQVLFAAFGAHLKDMAGVTSTVIAQGLLAIGGLGIIAGSITAGRLSRGHIETGLIPLGALGMTLCLALIPGIAHTVALGALLAVYGFFGGIFVVPLNALIQFNAKEEELGTILAGNNFVQNVAMLSFLCATVAASLAGMASQPIILSLAAIVAIGSVYTLRKLPQAFLRFLLRAALSQRYRLHVAGLEHIPSQGGVLLLGNHTSWFDWAILHLAVPRPVRFVMTRKYYDLWYVRRFLDYYRVIPISTTASGAAMRSIIGALQNGECVALFPEGTISRNGQLGVFRRGYSIPAQRANCPVIPFYLRGLWGSSWSSVTRHFRRTSSGRTRSINLRFGAPLPPSASPLDVKNAVHRLSILAWQDFAHGQNSIPKNWILAAKRSPKRLAVADTTGRALTNASLLAEAATLSKSLRSIPARAVAVMLPPGTLLCVANMGALMAGKTVVNLDPDMDESTRVQCLDRAQTGAVITSADHASRARSWASSRPVIALDDAKRKPSVGLRFLIALLPGHLLWRLLCSTAEPDQPAAVVFTQRTGPSPLGIELSHTNIITNVRQITSLFPPKGDDVLLAAIPPHRALGLITAVFLPLLESIPVAGIHDPFNAKRIGRLCVDHEPTLLFATPAMLRAYVHDPKLHPLLLASLRTVVSSGQGLSEACVQAVRQKFGLLVHEGYGTTETTPMATLNAPDAINATDLSIQQGRKPGTVGLPVPGAALRVVDDKTLSDLAPGQTGRILIGGTQLMQGYLNDRERTAQSIVEQDGIRWFMTSDRGFLDEDGFLTVCRGMPQTAPSGEHAGNPPETAA